MSDVQAVQSLGERILAAVQHAVVGMTREVRASLVAVLSGGHVLLEGPPGVAKTLLVRSLAAALGGQYGRVQFTPDLMPADVTGTSVFRPSTASFEFRPGPVFCQLCLCDEINRAPAKTQAALLEAMQEGSVTVDGERHLLPQPFTVFATQNPLEHEGTYPLPEAQLDRFLLKVLVRYPDPDVEKDLLTVAHPRPPRATPEELGVEAVTDPGEIESLREVVRAVAVRDDLVGYVVKLLTASSRVMLIAAAKAFAALEGRDFVTPDDLKVVAVPALRHRVQLDPAEELGGSTPDDVLRRILDSVEVPR